MRKPFIIDRALRAIERYRAGVIRRRDQAKVSGLPEYLLKDIGWPACHNDCHINRAP